jgi:hypothetical protein
LGWLARPGDPLVAPAVPDMIALFEAEANRRLRVIDAERHALLTMPADGFMVLPQDCWGIRSVALNGLQLQFMPPGSEVFSQPGGSPLYYSLLGYNQGGEAGQSGEWLEFWLFVGPTAGGTIELMYQVGVPPLGPARPSNWLLESHSDAYLFGTLAEAELYIGHDERAPLWLQRRDASFQSIENYDRKTRWAGPMQIRAHGIQTGAGSASGGAAPAPAPLPVAEAAVRMVNPFSGALVTMLAGERALYVAGGPRAALTIWLPPAELDMLVEISFANPVTALTITDADGLLLSPPENAYGPGAGLQFRYLESGWVYWA